jgi:hypothetical protein
MDCAHFLICRSFMVEYHFNSLRFVTNPELLIQMAY